MTIFEATAHLKNALVSVYDVREAKIITDMAMESLTSLKRIDRLIRTSQLLSEKEKQKFNEMKTDLLSLVPIQYVIGQAWFGKNAFIVNHSVLIPRPETEELVNWILNDYGTNTNSLKTILDIGTGSGCIALSLGLPFLEVDILGIDISEAALKVAQQNSVALKRPIRLQQLDFLDRTAWDSLGSFDCIVSNPPYIKQSEKAMMHENVLSYEPHQALFVEENDPLCFYTAIAEFATNHLILGGSVYVEINEALGAETMVSFNATGFETHLKKDLQGKDRMIKAWKK